MLQLGHSKHSIGNLYAYVDSQPYEGSGPGKHQDHCANNDGAKKDESGWGEVWASNRCHLTRPGASVYAYGDCDPGDLNSTVNFTFNNTFMTPDAKIVVQCKGTRWSLAEYQQRGYDIQSTETVAPSLETLIGLSRELIALA